MKKKSRLTIISVLVIIAAAFAVSALMPTDPQEFKAFALIPAAFLIVYIFVTKRVVEGLILSSLFGVIMIARPEIVGDGNWIGNTFSIFSSHIMDTMLNEDTQWLIIVCGLMGSIIALIEKSGGARAFGEWAATKAKTQKSALLWTWLLGIIIFIDDYLNSLTVGACMTAVTDKYKTPREYLAYVVDSTAAPVCALIPVSTWAVFVARILELNDCAPEGKGMVYFIKTIPYDFYAWIALLVVPLVIIGVIPIMGPMKKAEERVKNGGPLAPKFSERVDIHSVQSDTKAESSSVADMLVPSVVLIAATIMFGIDMQQGVLAAVGFSFIYFLARGRMTAEEFVDCCVEGFKSMILPLLLMILAFLFAMVNREIHFTEYVITTATQTVTVGLLPFIIFVALSITEFITGTNWGMYVIALPIVVPIAQTMDANMSLAVAAVLSAGVFGSHICFYSDATVVTSAATGCDNMQHAITQLPYGLISAGLAAICFLVSGLLIG